MHGHDYRSLPAPHRRHGTHYAAAGGKENYRARSAHHLLFPEAEFWSKSFCFPPHPPKYGGCATGENVHCPQQHVKQKV